jgi:hypothetical protein
MKIFNIETYVCRVGENARDNWGLLEESKGNYVFFHLSSFSSCYLILECDYKNLYNIPNDIIIKAAELCKSRTKYRNLLNIRVDYTFCSNVKRGEAIGEIVYKSNKQVKCVKI